MQAEPTPIKAPRLVLPSIYAFGPNRETLGGTAYLIVENTGNILVDCPLWEEKNQDFLQSQGGVLDIRLVLLVCIIVEQVVCCLLVDIYYPILNENFYLC